MFIIVKNYDRISAGGLVINNNNDFLLIQRKGKWDLPKGRLETNENLLETAKREISEETGLEEKFLNLISKLDPTVYTKKQQLRQANWFLFRYEDANAYLFPQTSEGITMCKWVSQDLIPYYFSNMRNYSKKVLLEYNRLYTQKLAI